MPIYSFRIDTQDREQIESLLTDVDKYLYCLERGSKSTPNPHCHIVVESRKSRQTYQKRIQALPSYEKGNRFYASKHLLPTLEDPDIDRPWAYLFKEDPFPVHKNCTKEEIEKWALLQEKIAAEIQQDLQKKFEEKKGLKTKIYDIYFKDLPTFTHVDNKDYPLRDGSILNTLDVSLTVVRHVQENEIDVFESRLVSVSQTLCLKVVPGYGHTLATRINDRIN